MSAHQAAVDRFHTVTEQRKTGWYVVTDETLMYKADNYHSYYSKELAMRIARDVRGFADVSRSNTVKDVVVSLKGYEAP